MSDLLGMRGTGDWSNEERPKSFREGLLFLFPNGDMPLTAINSKGPSRKVTDPEFKYFSKKLKTQKATLTNSGIYTDAERTAAATGTGTVGITYYAEMAAADIVHFREGHTVLGIDASITTNKMFGKVTAVVANGASSYVAFILRTAGVNINLVDTLDIIGSAHSEGESIPDAISYAPDKFSNFTQIFRTPLEITRTMRRTKMRIGDVYQEAKREAAQYHGIEMEMAAILGEKSEVTGANGKPERTTQGIISFINEHVSANIVDFATGTSLTWKQAGEDWFDEQLELLFRFGSSDRVALVGNDALLGIMKLIKQSGHFSLTVDTMSYGIKVMRWVTPFGEVFLKTHPLFTQKGYMTSDIVFYDPNNVQFSFIDDTMFKRDDGEKMAGQLGVDGTKEEFLTEAGWEWHFPDTMMYLTSLNTDGTA